MLMWCICIIQYKHKSYVSNEAGLSVSLSFLLSRFDPALDLCSLTENALGGADWSLQQLIYYCALSQDLKELTL